MPVVSRVRSLHGGAVDGFVGLAAEGVGGVAVIELAENVGAGGGADLDDELVAVRGR